MMRRAKCLHINNYSTNPSSNLEMLSDELKSRQSISGEIHLNSTKLWGLWKWIQRVEILNEEACSAIENGESPEWPARCLTSSGVLELLRKDKDNTKEKLSETLQCTLYDSPMRRQVFAHF